MSKKAAENLDALVLQLTFGKAAFMKTEQDARSVGRILVRAVYLLYLPILNKLKVKLKSNWTQSPGLRVLISHL